MKTTLEKIFVTSCSHFLRLVSFLFIYLFIFFFFLIFQNQSAAGDVIKQIKIKKPNFNNTQWWFQKLPNSVHLRNNVTFYASSGKRCVHVYEFWKIAYIDNILCKSHKYAL